MIEFIKKNIFIGLIFLISLILGFFTFLTFIDKGFLELTDQKPSITFDGQHIFIISIFFMIFKEVKLLIKN